MKGDQNQVSLFDRLKDNKYNSYQSGSNTIENFLLDLDGKIESFHLDLDGVNSNQNDAAMVPCFSIKRQLSLPRKNAKHLHYWKLLSLLSSHNKK